MSRTGFLSLLLLAGGAAAPAVAQGQASTPAPAPVPVPMFSHPGYLKPAEVPDIGPLVGPPPQPGSPGQQRDEAARDAALRLRGTPRYLQAQTDADLRGANPPGVFSCAADADITPTAMPRTDALLMRAGVDFGLSTHIVKARFHRVRPFAAHHVTSCTPADENILLRDGSYPSGHSVMGWGWALILAELDPGRADQILQRGYAFGQSRVVCDVHWQSDVDSGRTAAAAVLARLHGDPTFREDLRAARAEFEASRLPQPPAGLCAAQPSAPGTGG